MFKCKHTHTSVIHLKSSRQDQISMGIELFAMAMAVAQVAIYLGLIGEASFWSANKALLGSNHKSYSINVHKDTGD